MNSKELFQVMLQELNWAYGTYYSVLGLDLQTASAQAVYYELSLYTELTDFRPDTICEFLQDRLTVIPPRVLARFLYVMLRELSYAVFIGRDGSVVGYTQEYRKHFAESFEGEVLGIRLIYLMMLCNGEHRSLRHRPLREITMVQGIASRVQECPDCALYTAYAEMWLASEWDSLLYVISRLPKSYAVHRIGDKSQFYQTNYSDNFTIQWEDPIQQAEDLTDVYMLLLDSINTVYGSNITMQTKLPEWDIPNTSCAAIRELAGQCYSEYLAVLTAKLLQVHRLCLVPLAVGEFIICDPGSIKYLDIPNNGFMSILCRLQALHPSQLNAYLKHCMRCAPKSVVESHGTYVALRDVLVQFGVKEIYKWSKTDVTGNYTDVEERWTKIPLTQFHKELRDACLRFKNRRPST